MIPRELIDEILTRADIVDVISSYINVVKKGRNYAAICPFHDDKNPSMMISKEKQIYKCFVCQEGGNALTFIQHYENIGFEEAVKKLAELINFEDPRLHEKTVHKIDENKLRLFKTLTALSEFYEMSLYATEGINGREYLKKRNLSAEVIKTFGIGYCPENSTISIAYMKSSGFSAKDLETVGVASLNGNNYLDRNASRIIFPIKDINGQVVGFSARSIVKTDEAKYVNSPETPVFHKSSILYNYHVAKKHARIDGYVYVVEGFMDAIALFRTGINSVVALMGTAMTNEHIDLLRKLNCEIRMCLDGDNAGQMATMKCVKMLDDKGIKYRIVKKDSDYKDADDMLEKKGTEYVEKYLSVLIDKAQYALAYYQENNPLLTIEDRKKYVNDIMPLLVSITSKLELEDYLRNISVISKFSLESLKEAYNAMKNKKDGTSSIQNYQEFHPEKRVLNRLVMTEKNFLYQMLTNAEASDFYRKNNVSFTDDLYRQIANYIIELDIDARTHNIQSLITGIENSDDSLKEALIKEIANISLEKTQPNYSDTLLQEYNDILAYERQKIQERFIRTESLKGKTDIERLKILKEFNRRKNEKLNANSTKRE